jgi:hypothetical protein
VCFSPCLFSHCDLRFEDSLVFLLLKSVQGFRCQHRVQCWWSIGVRVLRSCHESQTSCMMTERGLSATCFEQLMQHCGIPACSDGHHFEVSLVLHGQKVYLGRLQTRQPYSEVWDCLNEAFVGVDWRLDSKVLRRMSLMCRDW